MKKKITIHAVPVSLNALYRAGKGRYYMTRRGKQAKSLYQTLAWSQWKQAPLKGKIEVRVRVYFPDRRKRDIDNCSKVLLDSLEGIVYENDSQIFKLELEKRYDKEDPRFEVTVAGLDELWDITLD